MLLVKVYSSGCLKQKSMNVNSKHKNDFDDFVREQIDKVTIDFNESHWNQLESELNKPTLKGKVWGQVVNYKLLFYLTFGVLMALISLIIYYRISQQNKDYFIKNDEIHQTTNTYGGEQIQHLKEEKTIPFSSPNPKIHSKEKVNSPQHSLEYDSKDNTNELLKENETDSEQLPSKIYEDTLQVKQSKKKYIIW